MAAGRGCGYRTAIGAAGGKGAAMFGLTMRSPALAFAALALSTFVAVVAGALWGAHLPEANLRVRSIGTEQVAVEGRGPFHASATVLLVDPAGRVRLEAPLATLALDREPAGPDDAWRKTYAQRDAIAQALASEPGLRLRLPDGSLIDARLRRGGPGVVTSGFWLALGMGWLSALAGWWVLVLRPREWAARMFALSGLGMLLAAFTIAISERQSPAMSGVFLLGLGNVNILAGHLYGMSLVCLFARYPKPLVPRVGLGAIAAGLAALWGWGALFPSARVFSTHLAAVIVEGAAIVALAVVQGWRARRDPALRAAFLLIGTSLLVSVGFFSAVNLIPQMLGGADLVSPPFSACVFLLFDLALAIAIARYRLFDLGAWALNMAIMALVIMGLLAVDFAVVLLTGASWTLSTAFLLAAIAWLPLRERLLRRSDLRRTRDDTLLLRGASEVAFALTPNQQEARWQALLESRFTPLVVDGGACIAPEIRDDGRALAVPSPLGGTGLVLRHAGQGSRLFGSADRAVAVALVELVREMAQARAAHDRGVQAERQRIARDLHDDVGARLMTTLHRADLETVHADVREAMADMRLIIDGMAGQTRPLSDLLADLRHEAVNRLALARIAAFWPVDALFDDALPVDARRNRILFSVVRELVSNAIRHAGAQTVRIEVARRADALIFNFSDDGRGFSADEAFARGNGLRNMRKRMEEVGGALDMTSGAAGTVARITLPLRSPEQGMAPPPEAGHTLPA